VVTDGPLKFGSDRRRGESLSDGFPRAPFDHCGSCSSSTKADD